MHFKLISFVICPYVQRAAITLKFKKVPFDVEYIDLKNKPDWFLKLSPLGKVPVLQLNNTDVVFESTVINELLDELNPPVTLSTDLIIKAKERAWIMFSDSLFSDMRNAIIGDETEKYTDSLMSKLEKLEDVISDKGFFKSEGFSIVDSSYAPLFFRIQYLDQLANHPKLMKLKKIRKWSDNLLAQDYVKQSVRNDFETIFKESMSQSNPNIKFTPNVCKI